VKLASPELTQPSIVLACVGDDLGRSIENTLQLVGRLLLRTDQESGLVSCPFVATGYLSVTDQLPECPNEVDTTIRCLVIALLLLMRYVTL